MFDLSQGFVHLWFAEPGEWREEIVVAEAFNILSADEVARMELLRFREDQHLYGISHWLVRTALSHYEGRPPGAWRFVANDYGKPLVDPAQGPSLLTFSLAHTRGLAVVAITKGAAVGVDVERTDRLVDAPGLVRRFFAEEEIQALGKLPPEALNDRFFLHWTLKEAGLKALGAGLSLPLSTFAFCLSEGRPRRVSLFGPEPPRKAQWQWAALTPRPRYMTALGVAGTPGETLTIRGYRATPSGKAEPLACEPIALSEGIRYQPAAGA
ncbi:MAG: 4'-phosphopantetheinyl transferase superfamily protein [Deltaproteobacteria bacterium]|nr:4'-phosphopantetheinyl transferase superfamily protein [Deltaproteobacteria bacterium]